MAIPQNITDDLTALDGALTKKQASAAQVVTDQTAVSTAQATLTTDTATDQANATAVTTADAQLEADVAAWVAGGATQAEVDGVKAQKKKLLANKK